MEDWLFPDSRPFWDKSRPDMPLTDCNFASTVTSALPHKSNHHGAIKPKRQIVRKPAPTREPEPISVPTPEPAPERKPTGFRLVSDSKPGDSKPGDFRLWSQPTQLALAL